MQPAQHMHERTLSLPAAALTDDMLTDLGMSLVHRVHERANTHDVRAEQRAIALIEAELASRRRRPRAITAALRAIAKDEG